MVTKKEISIDNKQREKSDKIRNKAIIVIFLSVLLVLLPIAYGFFYIHQYGVSVPLDDQWGILVPGTISIFEGKFNPALLVAEQNDSRGPFPFIMMFGISVITGMDITAIFYTGYAIYVVAILGLSYVLLQDLEIGNFKFIAILPIVYYALNPYYLFRFIYNLGSLVSLFILFAFATIYLLDLSRSPPSSRRSSFLFGLSIIIGVMCSFSGAPGLSIWFAGIVQISLQKTENKLKKIMIWCAGAISTFYIYYIGLGFKSEGIHGTSGYYSYVLTALTYPLQKILCFMGTIGAEVVHDNQMALFFGMIMTAIFVALVVNNRYIDPSDKVSKWYGLLTLGTLTALELSLTRSGVIGLSTFGPPDTIFFIPATRHSYAIFLPLICLYCLALLYTKASFTPKHSPGLTDSNPLQFGCRERNIVILGMILALMASGTLLHILPGISTAERNYDRSLTGQYYLVNYRSSTDTQLTNLYYNPAVVRLFAPKLEQYHLNVFSPDQPKLPIFRFVWTDPHSVLDKEGNNLSSGYYKISNSVRIDSNARPAIFEHPQGTGGTLTYNAVVIPEKSSLDFYTGLDEAVWSRSGSDGVTYEIYVKVSSADQEEKIFSERNDPINNPNDRKWQHHAIDMERFAGQKIMIKLVTLPNDNNQNDWAWWGDPKIIST